MLWSVTADGLTLLHFLFVLFVLFGSFLVLRRPRLAWLHIPAVVWGAAIEFGGWLCPLTPLENSARRLAGEQGYAAGFVDHYLQLLLYPEGLARDLQLILGSVVVLINLLAYACILRRWRYGRAQ